MGRRTLPSLETLKAMVLRENQLRLSEEWQERFAAAERSPDRDWLDCVEDLQLQVVREFGMPDSSVASLRHARSIHPSERFFLEVPICARYNRARNGPLRVGSEILDVPVANLDGTTISLLDLGGSEQRPLVVIGGSRS